MGIVETVKDVAILVQKADNVELYQKIIELQTQIMAVLEENHSLKGRVRELSDQIQFQGSLVFRDNMYFRSPPEGPEDGPYCSRCWDMERKAVRLQALRNGIQYCPGCKKSAPGTGPAPDPAPRLPPPSGSTWSVR